MDKSKTGRGWLLRKARAPGGKVWKSLILKSYPSIFEKNLLKNLYSCGELRPAGLVLMALVLIVVVCAILFFISAFLILDLDDEFLRLNYFIMAPLSLDFIDGIPRADALEDWCIDLVAMIFIFAHEGFSCGVVDFEVLCTLRLCYDYFFNFAVVAEDLLEEEDLALVGHLVISFTAFLGLDWSEKGHDGPK